MSTTCNEDFESMNVHELRRYLQDRGVSVSGYLKPSLVELALKVKDLVLPKDPNFENDLPTTDGLVIHGINIPDPFTLKTVNDFSFCPPFGLYDIFNHLIYHSTEYDKQGLAAYKSFDDYRLFIDGYVDSLLTIPSSEAGVYVFVAKVRPFMKNKTDDGKQHYDLWFILEGRGANRGSVLQAFCKCKGGRDGGCKHIAAAMYSLEALLNASGSESVTSGPCIWSRKECASSKPCDVKDLLIKKGSKPYNNPKKRGHVYCQHIDLDVRDPDDTAPRDEGCLKEFAKKLCKLENPPVILPLLNKLYCATPESEDVADDGSKLKYNNNEPENTVGIMKTKLQDILKKDPNITAGKVLDTLSFSDNEIDQIESSTKQQSQCKDWFIHKYGFVTASKCKRVYTRQETLVKNSTENASKLIESILDDTPYVHSSKGEPQNAREWGIVHEESARKAYQRVASHTHHKVELVSKGFLISKAKPYLGASLDNIQKCQCADGCPETVIEYKCPWKHRHLHPKEAFLTPEIGGIIRNHIFELKPSTRDYYQVQLQMFVSELPLCNFIVWTEKGVVCVEVPYNQSFMLNVCLKLEAFWVGQVLPVMLTNIFSAALPTLLQEMQEVAAAVEVIEPTPSPPSSAAAVPSDSECVIDNGLQIFNKDLDLVEPNIMINDTIVLFLFRQLPQVVPIISTYFYTTLCGEQDIGHKSSRVSRLTSAEKFFKVDLLDQQYVFIPINRSLHWLLAVLTPWHLLILDSVTWDISIRHAEIDIISSYVNHLHAAYNLTSKKVKRSSHVLKVPQQLEGSNNCGFYLFMFIDHFLKDLRDYERNPEEYVKADHMWFQPHDAEVKRTLTRSHLKALFCK